MGGLEYVELHSRSAFSLLGGASTPEQLAAQAAELGLRSLALTDAADLGGAIRFAQACQSHGIRPIFGAELPLLNQGNLVLLCEDERGWAHLSSLITKARMHSPRGLPSVSLEDLQAHRKGLLCLSGGRASPLRTLHTHPSDARQQASLLREIFDDRFFIEVYDHHLAEDVSTIRQRIELANRLGTPWLVTNDVRYASAADRATYDAITCLRYKTTLPEAGDRLFPNDTRRLLSPESMARTWHDAPVGLMQTLAVAERCAFHPLRDLNPKLPDFTSPSPHQGPREYLSSLVERGLRSRYRNPGRAQRRQARHELQLIGKLGLAGYFLIVWDIVRFAQSRGILVQGRGSAANSVVCYCLGITSVDPVGMELLFERFLSEGRGEAPDIDLDIAHRDREDILQYVYERYGREHAAMVCETVSWRGKSAVRDAARVLGLPVEIADKLANEAGSAVMTDIPYDKRPSAAESLAQGGITNAGLDPTDPKMRALVRLLRGLQGLPRHRSIHVGGFVITQQPLSQLVPIEPATMQGRTVIQWDKDDLDPVGLVKIDLLGLGMLTLLSDTFRLLQENHGVDLSLHTIPPDDPATYEMIQRADTVGVFQIESRAQMNCLPRTRPERFYDLVVQVALIRPGPIQGEMVHPYIRRRRGEEPITYLHPSLKPLLKRTLGVPLFQEQGMKVAIEAAGFSPTQADNLRRAMGFRRKNSTMRRLCLELLEGMGQRGIERSIAERIVKQLASFASYGFPESHAASFALLVYASAFLKRHHAPSFYCALLNSQPMGFYPVGTVVQDAKRHGVLIRPPDITRSHWDSTLEGDALRLGLHMIRGLGATARDQIESALVQGLTKSIDEFASSSRLSLRQLRALAQGGAFDALAKSRRQAQWQVQRYARPLAGPLEERPSEPQQSLPFMDAAEATAMDYATLGASAGHHPVELLRPHLRASRIPTFAELHIRSAGPLRVVGLVNSRQRPATASGTVFLCLEDETGMANVVVWARLYEENRQTIRDHCLLIIDGTLERSQGTLNIIARHIRPLPSVVRSESHDFH